MLDFWLIAKVKTDGRVKRTLNRAANVGFEPMEDITSVSLIKRSQPSVMTVLDPKQSIFTNANLVEN